MTLRAYRPLVLAFIVAALTTSAIGEPPKEDRLSFVSIVPTGAVKAGEDVAFTFEVDVTLETMDAGWLNLGFNSEGEEPNRFRMVERYKIARGMERVKISARVRVRDWGKRGDFTALLNIGPREDFKKFTPSANLHRTIEVLQ